jgi:hypothetical protein
MTRFTKTTAIALALGLCGLSGAHAAALNTRQASVPAVSPAQNTIVSPIVTVAKTVVTPLVGPAHGSIGYPIVAVAKAVVTMPIGPTPSVRVNNTIGVLNVSTSVSTSTAATTANFNALTLNASLTAMQSATAAASLNAVQTQTLSNQVQPVTNAETIMSNEVTSLQNIRAQDTNALAARLAAADKAAQGFGADVIK